MSTNIDRPVRPGSTGGTTAAPAPAPDAGAYGHEAGSHRITPVPEDRRRRRTPLAWLPWAAFGLIAAIVLLSLLVMSSVGGDGPADGQPTAGQAAPGGDAAAGQPAAPAAAAPAPAALTVGDQDLLALAAGGGLGGVVGQPVTGTARVESVVSDEGFWVGSSPTDRVFVYLTPEARQTSGESGFRVTAGQTVQLTGTTAAVDQAPEAVAGVAEDEGLGQLRQQGSLVRAESVQLAG